MSRITVLTDNKLRFYIVDKNRVQHDSSIVLTLTDAMTRFICKFDEGKYPNLDKHG